MFDLDVLYFPLHMHRCNPTGMCNATLNLNVEHKHPGNCISVSKKHVLCTLRDSCTYYEGAICNLTHTLNYTNSGVESVGKQPQLPVVFLRCNVIVKRVMFTRYLINIINRAWEIELTLNNLRVMVDHTHRSH